MSVTHRVIAQLYSLVGFLTIIQNLIPQNVRDIFNRWSVSIQQYFNMYYHVISFPELKGRFMLYSYIFRRVDYYITNLDRNGHHIRTIVATRPPNKTTVVFQHGSSETIEDSFQENKMWWTKTIDVTTLTNSSQPDETRCFTLKMAKASKSLLQSYIDHIKQIANEQAERSKDISLYINKANEWSRIAFKHPCTFDCLAFDPALMEEIKADLDNFKAGKQFYRETGRPWKRGYLLHGPPGTGKSSVIAAIANYMKYDLFDLELNVIKNNDELRMLLARTTERSIILVEDIDCSLDVASRTETDYGREEDDELNAVTLSGLLDFTDGLCASIGEERIIIFTTNHPDDLDPALLRPGRMDMHIELSFCNFPAFKILAKNYLEIEDHELYAAVEEKIAAGAKMVPVDFIEILLSNLDHPSAALNSVISALDANLKEITDMPQHSDDCDQKNGVGTSNSNK